MSANHLSRRQLLGMSLKLGAVAMASSFVPGRAEARLKRTPGQVLGPFYPVTKPNDQDADLVLVRGRSGRAQGQVIEVAGRVLTVEGEPVEGARLEIWQANARGRYAHPSDPNPAPLDPNFEGFAVLVADAEGRYRFRTIKPGAYPTELGDWRTPHIHYEVTGRIDRLVTQMYFEGEPLNAKDRFLQATPGKERLVATLRPSTQGPGSLVAAWDIVLPRG